MRGPMDDCTTPSPLVMRCARGVVALALFAAFTVSPIAVITASASDTKPAPKPGTKAPVAQAAAVANAPGAMQNTAAGKSGTAVQNAPASPTDSSRLEIKKEVFVYEGAGRRDPFLSIIQAAKKAREKKKTEGGIPLENYDINQINLLAIIWDVKSSYALIGLPDGKFYTVREGMPLGIHGGKVIKISKNEVLVRENIMDIKGELKPHDNRLKLRVEEGQ